MTSPISDILKPWRLFVHSEYDGTNQLDEQLAAVTEAEQALTALLEAAIGEDETLENYTSKSWGWRNELRAEIRQKLGIGGNKG